jgi:hypothetical protein
MTMVTKLAKAIEIAAAKHEAKYPGSEVYGVYGVEAQYYASTVTGNRPYFYVRFDANHFSGQVGYSVEECETA